MAKLGLAKLGFGRTAKHGFAGLAKVGLAKPRVAQIGQS